MNFDSFSEALTQLQFPIEFPGHWINGKWSTYSEAKQLKPSINPSSGETLIVVSSDKKIYLDALDAADNCQAKLTELSLDDRVDIIRKMRQALADYQSTVINCLTIQGGKALWEAQHDLERSISFLDSFIQDAEAYHDALLRPAQLANIKGRFALTPVGTTIAFLPFSSPITSFSKYFATAVFSGCPLILSPSSHASLSGLLFAHIAEKIDLIKGSFGVVFGNFETFKKILSDRRIRAIIYTGSRDHCEAIRKESFSVKGRELIIQSGGKNSALVHSSADLEDAVRCVLLGALKATGQLCTATSRAFVHKSLMKDFSELISEKIRSLKIGPTDKNASDVFMGPIYSKKAVEKFLRYQTMAHREAEHDLSWGKILNSAENNYVVAPGAHIMKKFDPQSPYQDNVLFCPDIAIYEYDVLDSAIEMINHTDAPFCVSFLGDQEIVEKRINQFVAPNIVVNLPTTEAESSPAVAGKFYSGHHRYNGAGLAMLLSYPRLIRSSADSNEKLTAYPQL